MVLLQFNRFLIVMTTFWVACCAPGLNAEETTRFRTDADKDKTIPWFALVDGEFPPEGSAHAISGELIRVDHLERRFLLRVDRNDSQDRSVWDLPVDAVMLPYGSIHYHGAPAALQDIPLGTHLHGSFYLKAPDDKTTWLGPHNNRKTPEVDFRRCLFLEDDFTHNHRQNQLWKIDSVDLVERKLVATLFNDATAVGPPKTFDLLTSTRVMKDAGFGNLDSLAAGQLVLMNITWATLYGPGRIVDIWVDETSREIAIAHQLEQHRNHVRERGLAGWVDAVDDEAQIVTITFFGGVDPHLFDELAHTHSEPFGWPLSKPEDRPTEPKGTIAVARESLMTYDPVNDRKGGNILDIKRVANHPGSSGIQIQVKCDMLLEGYRPKRIVRFYPATWKVNALPREEQYHGRE